MKEDKVVGLLHRKDGYIIVKPTNKFEEYLSGFIKISNKDIHHNSVCNKGLCLDKSRLLLKYVERKRFMNFFRKYKELDGKEFEKYLIDYIEMCKDDTERYQSVPNENYHKFMSSFYLTQIVEDILKKYIKFRDTHEIK